VLLAAAVGGGLALCLAVGLTFYCLNRPATAAGPADSPWVPAVPEVAWRYIVIHHSASESGSAADFDRMQRLERHWDELGYHFVIGNGRGSADGRVEVGSRWIHQKWGAHCGGTPDNEYNNFGIGICLVGDFRQHSPTPAQLAALRELTLFLARRYQIPPERILGHGQAPGASTECPGQKLQDYVSADLRQAIASDQPE
jgi:N-acetyl-anhydromuramyl-L-alanine amidase AmpD